jgi:hypothetical protein
MNSEIFYEKRASKKGLNIPSPFSPSEEEADSFEFCFFIHASITLRLNRQSLPEFEIGQTAFLQ